MRIYILLTALLLNSGWSFAAEGEMPFEFSPDLSDQEALQRGARTFVNYCLTCHSASYMRYSRMGEDLGIPEDVLVENFMFGTDKVGDTMDIAMSAEAGEMYFGITPPDLSVSARARGAEWLYNYLMTFYLDPAKPSGINNLVFKDVAMPHVLWELQGWQQAVFQEETTENGETVRTLDHLELIQQPVNKPEAYQGENYEQTVSDLVNFMVYLGEPIQLKRKSYGVWVILYLVFLLVIVYFLKKEYWKDVN